MGDKRVVLLCPLHLDAGNPPGLSLSGVVGPLRWSSEKGGDPRPLPLPLLSKSSIALTRALALPCANHSLFHTTLLLAAIFKLGMELTMSFYDESKTAIKMMS